MNEEQTEDDDVEEYPCLWTGVCQGNFCEGYENEIHEEVLPVRYFVHSDEESIECI